MEPAAGFVDQLPHPWRVVLRRIVTVAGTGQDEGAGPDGGDGVLGQAPTPSAPTTARWLGALTAREHQVLVALAGGRAVKDVAVDLGITVNTCRGYAQQVLEKLGAHNRLEAVAVARRAGLLD
nr:LuxR C-terminal-related transcriptional regulator [Nocardioides litoris]